jgi:hypothetical protein
MFPEPSSHDSGDLDRVRLEFRRASRPFLGSAVTWITWAVALPAAALITARLPADAYAAVLFAWSGAILAGSAVEGVVIYRRAHRYAPTPLGAWALRSQGNLSMVALALSVLLVWQGVSWALPGLWLLLLGHSLFLLGGLAFSPFRVAGLAYQLGGLLALLPLGFPLQIFAATTAAANLWMAWSVQRAGAQST